MTSLTTDRNEHLTVTTSRSNHQVTATSIKTIKVKIFLSLFEPTLRAHERFREKICKVEHKRDVQSLQDHTLPKMCSQPKNNILNIIL